MTLTQVTTQAFCIKPTLHAQFFGVSEQVI